MIEVEKVLAGLAHCKQAAGHKSCCECPYYLEQGMCTTKLLNDATNCIEDLQAANNILSAKCDEYSLYENNEV